MTPIKTPKGLSNYQPGDFYGNLSSLKKKHPDLKLYRTAVRKSDGVKFEAGEWARLSDGEEIKIVAFDRYNYPLPMSMLGKPTEFNHNGFNYKVCKSQHKTIMRAIYYGVSDFIFQDLEEWKWLKD